MLPAGAASEATNSGVAPELQDPARVDRYAPWTRRIRAPGPRQGAADDGASETRRPMSEGCFVAQSRRSFLALGVGVALAALGLAPHVRAQSLESRIQTILSDPKLGADSRTGVVVMDADSGQVIAAHNADLPLIPASNMKLLSSGAALLVLGPTFEFETDLVYDSAIPGGRIVLHGSGDPALADPKLLEDMKLSVEDVLDGWIKALRDAGVSPGAELVVDHRVFDWNESVHPTWPVSQLNRWYCAEVAGVNFHANLLQLFAEPREPGRPPALKVEPSAPWLEIRNKARSVDRGNQTAWAERDSKGNGITLHGDVRYRNSPVEVALRDSPDFVARLLAHRLKSAGLGPAKARLAEPGEDLSAGRVVHRVTTNMATVMRRCNADSYNLYAESLLKRVGHEVTSTPGSWASGAAVLRMVLLERLGPEAGQAIIVADGSGMSRQNSVTARLVARWLVSMQQEPVVGEAFLASMPTAGEGTLRRRFGEGTLDCELRAKTGYLTGVSAISGYLTQTGTGRRVVYSIITNQGARRAPITLVRQMEEKIVGLSDEWLTDPEFGARSGSRGR